MTEKTTETLYLTYARSATNSEHDQPTSVDAQQSAMRLYVAEFGGTIIAEYSDTGMSGLQLNRPGFQGLLAQLSLCDNPVVLVTHTSHLGRGGTFHEALREIKSRGGRIKSVEQNNTFNDQLSDFTITLNRFENENPPKQLVLHDYNSKIVRQAFELYLKLESIEAVAEFLEIPSP